MQERSGKPISAALGILSPEEAQCMAWIKLDDGFADHPKLLAAGPLALVLQIRAFCYCSRHLTDGLIPESVLPILCIGCGQPVDCLRMMCDHRLWFQKKGKIYVQDFLKYNLSKAQRLALTKIRQQSGKQGGFAKSSSRYPGK